MATERSFPARRVLSDGDQLVVKVGSGLLTSHRNGLDRHRIDELAQSLAALRKAGIGVVLVSSGAVAEGVYRLGLKRRPQRLHRLQAAAAVGQAGLVDAYQRAFERHGLGTALVLLTHADFASRERYLNARSTLTTLLELGVLPIVNENDTVATEEIQFGDNDTLGALVANLLPAKALLMLTDRDGLYRSDPRLDPDARLLRQVWAEDPALEAYCGTEPGELGRGGMVTKVRAARQAARSDTFTVVANGREAAVVERMAAGEAVGTAFYPETSPLASRKSWLLGQLRSAGALIVDAGAAQALRLEGGSLLPVGVMAVEGVFQRGDLVLVKTSTGAAMAQGLVNYGSDETARLCGVSSAEIATVLGYCNERELIHRDNLVLLPGEQPVNPERLP